MDNIVIVLVGVLLAITTGAAIEYYKQLRKAQKEYEKAKTAVDDVILSFNRELKQEAEKLEETVYNVEANSSRSDRALRKVEEVNKRITDMEAKVNEALQGKEKTLPKLEEIDKKIHDTIALNEALAARLSAIEEQIQQFSMIPETKIREAVIPIKREKALAPLTETELNVLEMLSLEGPKTAPEIKERIKLSREHTARLMKKLYEGGYLDRETGKIPFKYSVKKEMEEFLKKSASEPTSPTER